ncbi:MAG TPA: SLATT domain-containing protein [Puia sp.]|nr:SLATT domain-containing protein [Puia sp.]
MPDISPDLQDLVKQKYIEVITGAQSQAKWYSSRRVSIKRWSRGIRFLSILLVGLGGIFPLIRSVSGHDVTNWGYITIAAAGTLLFVDRFFGFSSAWIRYTTTEMEIYKQVKEFESRWQIESLKGSGGGLALTPDKAVELLTVLKDFSAQIDELVKQETNAWATEFQTNIAELQKLTQAKLDMLKPGSVRIKIGNTAGYTNIGIKIDGIFRKKSPGSETLLDNLSPGPHEISITGDKGGNTQTVTAVVETEANKLATLEVVMP